MKYYKRERLRFKNELNSGPVQNIHQIFEMLFKVCKGFLLLKIKGEGLERADVGKFIALERKADFHFQNKCSQRSISLCSYLKTMQI